MNWNSNTLILLKYNNYYNRIVKKENTLEDYLDYEILGTRLSATNFNPNDGVNTTHTINIPDGLYPDYIIVIDENNQIVSRWFIIETNRIRGGQYTFTLRRDLMVDFYEDILDAPCFIEKATLNEGDPLLFNEEDMTFNQIKTNEFLLQDNTKCPWIVGYYAKNTPDQYLTGSIPAFSLSINYDVVIEDSFENWENNFTNSYIKSSIDTVEYRINGIHIDRSGSGAFFENSPGYIKYTKTGSYAGRHITDYNNGSTLDFDYKLDEIKLSLNKTMRSEASTLLSQFKDYLDFPTESEIEEILNLNGKIIKDNENRYFSITVAPNKIREEVITIGASNLFNTLSDIINNIEYFKGEISDNKTFSIKYAYQTYTMTATELFAEPATWDLRGDKIETENAAYNIFAIPFGKSDLNNGSAYYTATKEVGLAAVSSIIETMQPADAGGFLYDIQLLPYCPYSKILTNGTIIANSSRSYSLITSTDENNPKTLGFILNIPKADFNFKIYTGSTLDAYKPTSAIETKISNQCDKFRLCSPNFNGYFDFSLAKNNGDIYWFDVDCTYKPYQPYIHINPNFTGLYGRDFNDPRGLICGGDFSLSQLSDKWQTYQIQNKNFQETFDRQIQNLEVSNKYQRELDIANAIAGTVQGGVTGATSGGLIGGLTGGILGTVVGGAASAWAGKKDVEINQALRNEAIDFTKDNFGYQLGNIQALPYTLTKVSSFNNNNKIFPILEYYTCTDREKEAFREKLKYNGMTVMAIGKIKDYIQYDETYIKGKIIRLPEINEDFHIANEISKEINLGVYIGGQE